MVEEKPWYFFDVFQMSFEYSLFLVFVQDFRNTVIIMTSNLGSAHVVSACLADSAIFVSIRSLVTSSIQSHFPPEFINRIDEIIFYVRHLISITNCGHGLTKSTVASPLPSQYPGNCRKSAEGLGESLEVA